MLRSSARKLCSTDRSLLTFFPHPHPQNTIATDMDKRRRAPPSLGLRAKSIGPPLFRANTLPSRFRAPCGGEYKILDAPSKREALPVELERPFAPSPRRRSRTEKVRSDVVGAARHLRARRRDRRLRQGASS